MDILKQVLTSSEADVIGITELGKNENNLRDERRRPSKVVKKWFENCVATPAWNERKSSSIFEPGGVMGITKDRSSAHTIKRGKDERRLGRWVWQTLKGKQEKKTTIITTYRAINTQVTAQNQLGYIRKRNVSIQPEDYWEQDLALLIERKKEEGDVIVIGDFNCNLNEKESKVNKFFETLNMREVIIEKYGKGPPTFAYGKNTIDGIFATERISIRQGEYGGTSLSPGDHLSPWVDIAESDMIGTSRDDRPPPILRKATSKIPSVRRKFCSVLNEEVQKHRLHAKAKELFNRARTNKRLTSDEAVEYEKIEGRLRKSVKYADSKCRKARIGRVPFSLKQKELMGRILVLRVTWKRMKLKGRPGRPRGRKLSRMIKKYKYVGPSRFSSLEEVETELKEASKAYNVFRPKASEYRNTHMGNLAEDIAQESGRDPEVVLKELLHRDQVKEHFKTIKRKEKRGARYGVDRVDIETNEGLRTLVNKKEIETEIIKANKEKLLQSRDTPLRQEPLRSLIGERMEFEKWERLLKKEIHIPAGLEEGTRLWFEAIQNFEDEPFDIEWTTEEYFEGWKSMSEDKSALPGIQAAHLKSIDSSTQAAEIISWMALIPLLTGYAPRQWKRGVDSMIPKKKNEWRPDKLRLILLMEARFNQNNKIIGRKMMEHGEAKGYLAREQFGSRKSKSAIEHALNKRITIDVARQSKTPAAYIANDAKSCYDRILLMVAYLTMRHMGVPEEAAKSSISTLVEMPRKVKTVYGESTESYSTNYILDEILHGIGQGNGYGPIIWAGISSPLLKILRDRNFGVKIKSPITREELEMAGYSFVDDTDQIEFTDEMLWEKVLENAQASLDLWECLLRTTGGALEPTKTDWVKVVYEWRDGVAKLERANFSETLTAKNPNGEVIEIKQIETSEARRTLGVWQSADGQEDTQKDVLIKKITEWGSATDGISNQEAKTASVSTLGRSIRYPLAATSLSNTQCKDIDKNLKKHVLGKLGVVRTAADNVAFGPVQMGGIGLHKTEIDQTIDHVKMIMQHGHCNTVTGKLLRNTIETHAIETGLGGNPFTADLDKVNYLTENTWIENTIRGCQKYDIEIDTSIQGIKRWTERDEFIMDRALTHIKGRALLRFNNVRLYLQVATTSDIANADGKSIDKNFLSGSRGKSPSPSTNAYQWPNVPEPNERDKANWTAALCKIYGNTPANPSLEYNNYRWFTYECKEVTMWNYDPMNDTIYQKCGKHWTMWKSATRHRRTTRSAITYRQANTTVEADKSRWQPITVATMEDNLIVIRSKGKYVPEEDGDEPQASWYSPLESTIDLESERNFIEQIEIGKGLLVADGSYKNGRSSAAIVAQHQRTESIDQNCRNTQTVTVPGHPSEQSSYRGELGGILAGIVYTNKKCEENNITEGKCIFGCDNKGALAASFGWKTPNPNWVCFDIVSMIRYHLRSSNIKWEGKHIKGHQDNGIKFSELSVEAQANVIADKKAKEELRRREIPIENNNTEGQPWHIKCKGQTITGSAEERLRHTMQVEESKKWWTEK